MKYHVLKTAFQGITIRHCGHISVRMHGGAEAMFVRTIIIMLCFVVASSTASFILDQGLGLDGMQVGGAYTANPLNCAAIYWNPANLVNVGNTQVYSSYSNLMTDVNQACLMVSTMLGSDWAVGVGYLGIQVSGMDYLGENAESLGSGFDYSNSVAMLALSYKLLNQFSLGLSYDYFQQKALAQKTQQSLSLAGKLALSHDTQLGVCVDNAVILSGQDELNPRYRLGIDQLLGDWNISGDWGYDSLLGQSYFNYGVVYSGIPLVDVKAGMNGYFGRAFLGLSLKLCFLSVDYMFSDPELGAVHSFGLGMNF